MTADPSARQTASDAAIAAGFARACGVSIDDIGLSRDGAGTLVADVPLGGWLQAATHARNALDLDFLDWLSAVDEPDADPAGVDVVLHIAATNSAGPEGAGARYMRPGTEAAYVQRILLRTHVPDGASVPSLTALWPGVAWHERETFEMFGVGFDGFDDGSGQPIRPLLLPEGFEGTPLRKSFVLAARAAKAWPGAKDPADSDSGAASKPGRGGRSPSRRKTLPPGVPDPSWGPRGPESEGPVDGA